MNARQRRRAHYLRSLSAPAGRDAAVAQAVDQHLADLDDGHRLRWDSFARAQALDIPSAPAGRR